MKSKNEKTCSELETVRSHNIKLAGDMNKMKTQMDKQVIEMKEEIKLLKVDIEVFNKQFKAETQIVDKKLRQNREENDKNITKVEAAQSETRNEIETLKKMFDDMNSMAVTKGEVKKNVEEHVVEFRDIVKQQIQDEMHNVDK